MAVHPAAAPLVLTLYPQEFGREYTVGMHTWIWAQVFCCIPESVLRGPSRAQARGKSLPAELCLVVAHTSRLSVIGRKSVMLILLFDGAFGVFSDGFHLVSARVRMEINDHHAHVDTNISSLPQT